MDDSTEILTNTRKNFVGQKKIVLSPDKLKQIIASKLTKNLYPTAIGYYPHAAYHGIERPNGIAEYILLYCKDGSGWVKIQEEKRKLDPNTFVIFPKNEAHSYASSQRDPWSIYWIHFTGHHASIIYQRYAFNNKSFISRIAFDENRIKIFERLFHLVVEDFSGYTIEMIYLVLIEFLSSIIYNDFNNITDENDVISKSILFMKDNLHKKYTISQLAKTTNYSVSRYSELFKKKTGCAPIQYFIQLKIQASCQYLYFTMLNIKQISAKIGFDDPFYFSRMFKKLMGESPEQYRKQNKK